MNSKIKAIIDRIKHLENDITIANEYLASGEHASWHGFSPFFTEKSKNGKLLPPHKDWVKNVFLPDREKALKVAEDKLEILNSKYGTDKT